MFCLDIIPQGEAAGKLPDILEHSNLGNRLGYWVCSHNASEESPQSQNCFIFSSSDEKWDCSGGGHLHWSAAADNWTVKEP